MVKQAADTDLSVTASQALLGFVEGSSQAWASKTCGLRRDHPDYTRPRITYSACEDPLVALVVLR